MCTRVTSFGRTFATIRSRPSRSIGLPSSTSNAVTAAPARSMTSFMRLPKTPATTTTTRSPGSTRETAAASRPVRPDPGMAMTSPEVWNTWRRSRHAGSRISSSNGGSYWIIAGCAIARMTRQGTSVGPGIIRIGRSSPRRQCWVLTRHLLFGWRSGSAPAAAYLTSPGGRVASRPGAAPGPRDADDRMTIVVAGAPAAPGGPNAASPDDPPRPPLVAPACAAVGVGRGGQPRDGTRIPSSSSRPKSWRACSARPGVRILDVRSGMIGGGRLPVGHVPGAVLAGRGTSSTIRPPTPRACRSAPTAAAALFGRLGIDHETTVVAYDDARRRAGRAALLRPRVLRPRAGPGAERRAREVAARGPAARGRRADDRARGGSSRGPAGSWSPRPPRCGRASGGRTRA